MNPEPVDRAPPCRVFRSLRPELNTGYFTVFTVCLQFLISLCFMVTGLFEAFLYERAISGLILLLCGIVFGILIIHHFFGWYYNSSLLLLSHAATCAVLGVLAFLAIIVLLFCDIRDMDLLNHKGLRKNIHVFLIEAILVLPPLFMFGIASWSRAKEINKFLCDAALYVVTLENTENLESNPTAARDSNAGRETTAKRGQTMGAKPNVRTVPVAVQSAHIATRPDSSPRKTVEAECC
ncbi:hypothetical protein L596_022845 [Steinernema carpocapsae]|uniref:Uncharacterized protein n=1 Tax=Steinernema carpocapsae TaxID=34508 RepID=A0A4U5MMZ0_STECR|nr:hypothetical protein L596_022845 [Steinernema carpocapsae]